MGKVDKAAVGQYGVQTMRLDEIDFSESLREMGMTVLQDEHFEEASTEKEYPTEFGVTHLSDLRSVQNMEDPAPAQRGASTPLHSACHDGDPVKVGAILANKGRAAVYLNALDEEGDSALHISARDGNLEVVKVLVKLGARVDIEDSFKSTPLHDAAQEGHVDIVQFLAKSGAEINRFDQNGGAPLHDAAWEGHVEVVKALVQAGGILNVMNSNGHTPLVMAKNANHMHVAQLIEDLVNQMQSQKGNPSSVTRRDSILRAPEQNPDLLVMRAKLSSRATARQAGTRSFYDFKPVPLNFPTGMKKTTKKLEVFKTLEEQYMEMQERMRTEAEGSALQIQASYDTGLGALEGTFDRRQTQLQEAFEVRKLQMQTDFEDQIEKLRRELARNQVEHSVRFNEAVGKHQLDFESRQEKMEGKLKNELETLHSLVAEAQQQTQQEFQGMLEMELTTLKDKRGLLQKIKGVINRSGKEVIQLN